MANPTVATNVMTNDFETVQTTTMHGVVKWYNQTGRYGVIKARGVDGGENFKEYFVYVDDVIPKELYDAMEVIFDAGYDQKNCRDIATNVSYRPDSIVNREVLHKINKIDLQMLVVACFDFKRVGGNALVHVLNALPLELPETFGELYTELMSLVDGLHDKPTVRALPSRGVHELVFELDPTDGGVLLGSGKLVPPCLSHTNELLVSNLNLVSQIAGLFPSEPVWMLKVVVINRYGVCVMFEHYNSKTGVSMLTSFGVSTDVVFSSRNSFIKTALTMHNGNSVVIGEHVMLDWKYMIKYPAIVGGSRRASSGRK